VPIVGLIAGAVCVGVAELELDTVEDLLVLLLFTVLSVDEMLVRSRDDVEVVELRDDELLDELVLLEVDETTLLLDTSDVNSYISSLFPAPQYS
jgi:hypothetical protein